MSRNVGTERGKRSSMPTGVIFSIACMCALIAAVLFFTERIGRITEEPRDRITDDAGSSADRRAVDEEIFRVETLLAEIIERQKILERLLDVRRGERVPVFTQEAVQSALPAREYADFGDFCAESGSDNEAAGYYRKSLDSAPSIGVMFAYAQSLYRSDPHLRDDREIVLSLREVLERQPFHEGALELLGTVSLEIGDVRTASDAYASLYELHPRDGEIASVYGRLLMRRERYAEAVEPLTLAMHLAEGAKSDDPSLAWDLGTCLSAAGFHEAAVEAFAQAIRLDAFFPPAHLGMAESLLALGFCEEASRSAAAYCDLREGDFRGYMVKGDSLVSAGDRVGAEMAWTNALDTLELNSREDVEKYLAASIRLAGSLMERERTRAALARSIAGLEYAECPELLEIAKQASEELGDSDSAEGYAKRLEKTRGEVSEEEVAS